MKKKRLIISIIYLTAFITAACMKTEKSPLTESSSEKTHSQSYSLEQFDFSNTHINGSLAENLLIDADITPITVYDKKLNQYHIKNAALIDASCEEYIQAINECYGTNIEILPDMYQTEIFLVSDYALCERSSFCKYTAGNNEFSDKYLIMEMLFSQYPLYSNTDDTNIINEELEKFKNYFQKFVDYPFSDSYICIHTNSNFYQKVKEISQLANRDIPASIQILNNEELYFVRLFAEIDSDFQILDIRSSCQIDNSLNIGEGISNNGFSTDILNCNYTDLVFDKNGKMLGFYMTHQVQKGELSKQLDILSAKDILEIIQKKYQSTDKNHSITISNVKLMYGDTVEENKEANLAEGCLSPVWLIQYYRKGDTNYTTEVYLAETGELLESLR